MRQVYAKRIVLPIWCIGQIVEEIGYPMAFGYPVVGLTCLDKKLLDQAICLPSLEVL